jgi:hypothetical protein
MKRPSIFRRQKKKPLNGGDFFFVDSMIGFLNHFCFRKFQNEWLYQSFKISVCHSY